MHKKQFVNIWNKSLEISCLLSLFTLYLSSSLYPSSLFSVYLAPFIISLLPLVHCISLNPSLPLIYIPPPLYFPPTCSVYISPPLSPSFIFSSPLFIVYLFPSFISPPFLNVHPPLSPSLSLLYIPPSFLYNPPPPYLGLLIVKRSFFVSFLNCFQKQSFCFWKKLLFLKTTHWFWTFRKRLPIVIENDRFY